MINEWKEYRIICDECGLDGSGTELYYWYKGGPEYLSYKEQIKYLGTTMPYSQKGIREARKIAKQWGWKYIDGKDICPICLKIQEKEKINE